jgi:signal transduction histidine kinase
MTVLMILLANSLFLGKFYAWKNRSLFYREYETIKGGFDGLDEGLLDQLREHDRLTGFLFYVAETDGQQFGRIVMSSSPGFALDVPPFGPGIEEMPMYGLALTQLDFVRENLEGIRQGTPAFGEIPREIGMSKGYDLVFASLLDQRYLLVIIRPVEQLYEFTAVTNQFLLAISLLAVLVSVIVAQFSARSVTKPIKRITEIGKHIADLDFSHRYVGHSRDEIGSLGNSINKISTKLDSTIRELEETNRKLQTEMGLQKQFFAGVSHEFKTPVGLIRGYSESLTLGLAKTPEEIKEFAAIILDESDRLNLLVSDILLLVRSESSQFVLDMKILDIIPFLEASIRKNSLQIAEKKLHIAKKLPESVMVEGDAVRLTQIVDNLLGNALRHVPANGTIAIEATPEDGGMRFSFLNEGAPIAPEHLAHLFDPFYSAFESRDKSVSGTGLGLSIVRNLVGKHNGRCGIENIEREGLSGVDAWFWLPVIP